MIRQAKTLFLLLVVSPVLATNYYVNVNTGNDNNSGLTTQAAKKNLSWFSNSTTPSSRGFAIRAFLLRTYSR